MGNTWQIMHWGWIIRYGHSMTLEQVTILVFFSQNQLTLKRKKLKTCYVCCILARFLGHSWPSGSIWVFVIFRVQDFWVQGPSEPYQSF